MAAWTVCLGGGLSPVQVPGVQRTQVTLRPCSSLIIPTKALPQHAAQLDLPGSQGQSKPKWFKNRKTALGTRCLPQRPRCGRNVANSACVHDGTCFLSSGLQRLLHQPHGHTGGSLSGDVQRPKG